MRYQIYRLIILLLAHSGLALSSCGQQPARKTSPDTLAGDRTIPGNFSSQAQLTFDSAAIAPFLSRHPAFRPYAGELNTFYHNRRYAYAWFERSGLIEQAGNLTNRILSLPNEGVTRPVLYPRELDSLVHSWTARKPDLATELMLTAQYFVFAELAWQGLDPGASRSTGWYLPRKKVDYATYLDSMLKAPALIEPVYRQYELLRAYLRKYRGLEEKHSWEPINLAGQTPRPGDTLAVIPGIRTRLYLLEDLNSDTGNAVFDEELQAALRRFQARHGLASNGLLTTATLTELNVPLKSRIRQLIVNMERSRWLPIRLDGDYLGVNIPEFRLHVYHADTLLWSCNVVVGQTVHPTSVFYGEVKYVVFNPYWDVPESIVRKEILPDLKKQPNYLTAHHMQVTGYRNGLPVIRQLPGQDNALGLVKFLFPNNYNIYLHDTPSKSLFGETARAFSHGCIRVQEPVKLANFLLGRQPGWDAGKIDRAMHTGKEQWVTLTRKVPVFIAYLTAFMDREGRLNFRKDIYGRDEPLGAMLLTEK